MKISYLLGITVLFVVYEAGQTAPAGRNLLQWRGYPYGNQQRQRPQPQRQQGNQGWRPQNQWRMDPEERFEQQEDVFENRQELREDAYENGRGPLRQMANGPLAYNSQSREVFVGNPNGPAPLVGAMGAGGWTQSSEFYDGSFVPSSLQPNAYYRNGNQPWYPNWWD